ncbi:MAG: hypothetical protein JNK05_11385 [Myxococcales bacterium]|nr:hypothetical protein [Myxococcales bacterium]
MRFLLRTRGETSCVRCRGAINNGEAYVERESTDAKNKTVRLPLHPECALDVDTSLAVQAFERFEQSFEGRGAFRELATIRSVGRAQRVAQRRSREVDPVAGVARTKEPSRPREDDPHWVSPALDHRGRPRVRVLVAGSGTSLSRTAGRSLRVLLPARSWPSPKREYVFVTESSAYEFPDNDPAQPIVGAVYMPIATAVSTIEGGEDVCAWSALGVPPPLLWLIGVSSSKPRDEHTIRFRELMDHFGYDGDTCAVLCAPRVNAEALDRLVRVMDEVFDGTEIRAPINPWVAIAERLRDDIRGKHVHRYKGPHATIAHRLLTLRWTRDDVMNPLAAECAKLLLEQDDLEDAAQFLCSNIVLERGPFERWFERWWTSKQPGYAFAQVAASYSRLFSESGIGAAFAVIPPASTKIPRAHLQPLAIAILWQGDDEDIERIERVLVERAEDETFTAAIRPALADLRERRRAEQERPDW